MVILFVLHSVIFLIIISNGIFLRRNQEGKTIKRWPKVSILVPARNEQENLQRLLPSLWMQDYPDFEVIVVDDASEDATWSVLESHDRDRLKAIRGSGPPEGWIGKVHAAFRAAEAATGEILIFLDADVLLNQADSLRNLASRLLTLGEKSVVSGLPQYVDKGAGLLLTSMVPFALLSTLPLGLIQHTRSSWFGALNGQCWMIRAEDYQRHQPFEHHKDEVLEDVQIGRYLKKEGMRLFMLSLQKDVSVHMYTTFGEAWRGFRKNAYLIMGGNAFTFLIFHVFFWIVLVLAPLFGWYLLISQFLLKASSDRIARLPFWVSLLTPLTLLCAVFLQLDSALSHWSNRVSWKGRQV